MPRLNLDQLLSSTGVGTLAGQGQEKTAAPVSDFSKLAQRCRQAAKTSPEELQQRQLIEKTAQVAVIAQTLAEINEIVGHEVLEKTAEVDPATFIKAALEAGHRPEEIAAFLKEAGPIDRLVERVKGGVNLWRGERALNKARALGAKAKDLKRAGMLNTANRLRDAALTQSPEKAERLLSSLRGQHGDKAISDIIGKHGIEVGHLPTGKALAEAQALAAANAAKAPVKNTVQKVKSFASKHPGAMIGIGGVGAGALANARHRNDDRGGRRVIVV